MEFRRTCRSDGETDGDSAFLGTLREYCEGYFHVEASVEACAHETCLICDIRSCRRKTVTCIATLNAPGLPERSFKYSNARCDRDTKHAEEFMCDDPILRAHLSDYRKGGLVVYMTYQPCHYSGGHLTRSCKSCTLLLRDFVRTRLRPLGISRELVFAYTYRAHWEKRHCDIRYWTKVDSAIVGIQMLKREGVQMRSFSRRDWKALLRFASPKVRAQVRELPVDLWHMRHNFDDFVGLFLQNVAEVEELSDDSIRLHMCTICSEASDDDPFGADWSES